ncbi:MAG: phosphatidate cytidylyltransferase [Eubacterium sp.]|nr:phosphatidate cytidylyltransferase [Eubacterium sp.]
MFFTRLISGIILVLLALLTIIKGGVLLYITVLALSLIGVFELYRACKVRGEQDRTGMFQFGKLEIAGYAGVLLFYAALLLDSPSYELLAVIAALMILMCVFVFAWPAYRSEQVMACFFALVYVGVMLSFIYQTRMLPGGKFHVWLIFLCSWGCDTCAYCVGMLFGKRKMAPELSPKKSVEGAVGGVIGAIVLGIIYAVATKGPVLAYGTICGVGALISMVGDLAASAIKRNVGIKDYGKLIPGHGGVLDRFDSVIFTAPVIYFLSAILIA